MSKNLDHSDNKPLLTPDALQPHNVEAEQALLGSLLIDSDSIMRVSTFLNAEDFFVERHGWVYEAISYLYEKREPSDLVTLSDELERRNQLEQIGGPAQLTSLINATPTSIHAEFYARIIERTAVLRRLIDAAGRIARLAYEDEADVDEVVDRAEEIIFNISARRVDRDLRSISQIIEEYNDRLEYLYQHQGEVVGIPTGLTDLDKILGGLQRSDMVVMAGRPGMGKCVSADTLMVNPTTGELATIETLVQQRQANLLTLTNEYKLQSAQASDFVDDGLKPTYRVRTALGREIKVTLTHPFLTVNGWQALGDLKTGDYIAVPRIIPVFGQYDAPAHEAKLLAYLLGDGCLTSNIPQFSSNNPRLRDDFIAASQNFPGIKTHLEDSQGQRVPTVYVSGNQNFIETDRHEFATNLPQTMHHAKLAQAIEVSPTLVNSKIVPTTDTFISLCNILDVLPKQLAPDGLPAISHNSPNSLTMWLREQGIWGKLADQKEIPDCVYRYTRPKLALFLNRLFACDGTVYLQLDKQAVISYSTISLKLARGVQHLLLRFGIIAKLRHRQIKNAGSYRPAYQLRITGIPNLRLLVEQVGAFGKEEAITQVEKYIQRTSANTNTDTIPLDIWDDIKQVKKERIYDDMGLPQHANIHVDKRAPSRDRLLAIGQAIQSEELINLAQSDLYWDKITQIEYLGEQQVYDLTVPETHNFVADDMIVHNTSLALSIALQSARRWTKRIAIFSLEMSGEQLVQRLISAETGISIQRLRVGDIKENEWATFIQAANVLSNTNIFIDDTPAISAYELRTKSRRLHAEHGIDIVIVDYLQLMRGESRSENRQQEISFISRSIKSLARELNVPILALSQLSRQVESRQDKRPILSDLRESGCLTGDTLVNLANGKQIPICNVQSGSEVLTLNESTLKIELSLVSNMFSTGVKPVYKLTTAMGRTIRATGNHKFRASTGWTRLDNLDIKHRIAVPRRVVAINEQTMSSSDIYWDKIVSIEPDGEEEVFDLTIPSNHNFLANNIIAHNSIEQDSDIVMFIYRDEVYNEDTEFPNIAEIIVGKHRSGPTGKISVFFQKELTKFTDLEVTKQSLDY
ncbi:replicative DNA helicase [Anaerolineales bacterium HSG24]|nr:replicative DNA helicase [Anaerolineales bacterium HSG24]